MAQPTPDGLPPALHTPTPAPAGMQTTVSFDDPQATDTYSPGCATEGQQEREAGGGQPLPDVPGYAIEGVLGRGGMGVVYRARQLKAHRLVALKMIRAVEHATPQERLRFQNETEAVARLQHPNIVQLFEVGEVGGQPYFSLEFCRGGSLEKKLNGTPLPAREAAALVETLARAVQAAHEQHVIHRDLKPANVLLAEDGTPKITDFGLAKKLDEAGQTQSGAIVGTPSYMAPEQAAGRVRDIGPLADVYALGAILYELLTGRAPFRAESWVATLELVLTREPVPPAQLQPGVSRDLDTVCLKCLQKEPARRYESALELANDLRRFLAGEPIRARPVSARERLWRWCRRNQGLAWLSGTVALLLVAIAVGSSVFAWHLKRQKDQADLARDDARNQTAIARQQQREAENARNEARDSAVIAAQKKGEAETARDAAQSSAKMATTQLEAAKTQHRFAVDHMIHLVEKLDRKLRGGRREQELPREIRDLRNGCLDLLRESMLSMSRDFDRGGELIFGQANAHFKLGSLFSRLHRPAEANQQYRLGCDLCRALVKQQPESDRARGNLAVMLAQLADSTPDQTGDLHQARKDYLEARRLQQEIADHPRQKTFTPADNKRLLSIYDAKLGKVSLRLGDLAAARKNVQECLELRRGWVKLEPNNIAASSYLAEAQLLLADASWRLGDAEAAHRHYREATDRGRDLATRFPRDWSFRVDVAEICGSHGDLYLRQGKAEQAAEKYRIALAELEYVAAQAPGDLSRFPILGQTHYRLGLAALHAGKRAEADAHFRSALSVQQGLADDEPSSLDRQSALMVTLARCGRPEDAAGKAEGLRPRAARNPELLLRIAACYALGAAQAGDAAARAGLTDRAIAALRQAVRQGYRDPAALRTEPDLEAIRAEPTFQKLLTQLK